MKKLPFGPSQSGSGDPDIGQYLAKIGANTWAPETRFSFSFMHNGFFHQSFHSSIAEAQMEAARFGLSASVA